MESNKKFKAHQWHYIHTLHIILCAAYRVTSVCWRVSTKAASIWPFNCYLRPFHAYLNDIYIVIVFNVCALRIIDNSALYSSISQTVIIY